MTEAMTIDDVMASVAKDIAAVGVAKDSRNKDQGYNFRGIDQVLNTVGPIMARHGLGMSAVFSDRTAEALTTKNGGSQTSVVVTGTFTYRWRNETRQTVTIGEARDTADKATNKAMAMATKYAHVLTFNIPVIGTDDADATDGGALNDTRDRSGVASKMVGAEFQRWTEAMKAAADKPALRTVLKDALAKAQEYGDNDAHALLKASAASLAAGMPA